MLATGYETGLRALFAGEESVLDDSGNPPIDTHGLARGLYFCGFNIVPAGLIRQIGIEAVRIGDRIAVEQRAA